ncbi:BspA family leucine-rich repeat surface protein [Mycoplasma capricolum subsp. capricolum]|uniref:BspA family leucine-rich repeat surface protein n=1 Tax=Mycoplasma capricolum TaxID=2095 RepID=UPI0020BDA1D0|nr:BspA family leucine-rich repeat surface protein [Mycoplasma capricolum]MCK8462136.1 BspA family leucine-rich repeat surface protein [Mycoplasma capricolum subsp. capricolum]
MKKLLTILTSISAVFLITAGIIVTKNHGDYNLRINYNFTYIKRNKIEGDKLVEIGYYQWNGHKRIQQIPTTVKIISAQLPREITSLRSAFAGAKHDIKWEVKWDTSNVTDMNSLFYNRDDLIVLVYLNETLQMLLIWEKCFLVLVISIKTFQNEMYLK